MCCTATNAVSGPKSNPAARAQPDNAPMRLIFINKPFHLISAFKARAGQRTLADLLHAPRCRTAGRLDFDSEGLLLLTDDGALQARLTHPRFKVPKTYFAQVEGTPDDEALEQLCAGIRLADGPTRPARISRKAEHLRVVSRRVCPRSKLRSR